MILLNTVKYPSIKITEVTTLWHIFVPRSKMYTTNHHKLNYHIQCPFDNLQTSTKQLFQLYNDKIWGARYSTATHDGVRPARRWHVLLVHEYFDSRDLRTIVVNETWREGSASMQFTKEEAWNLCAPYSNKYTHGFRITQLNLVTRGMDVRYDRV